MKGSLLYNLWMCVCAENFILMAEQFILFVPFSYDTFSASDEGLVLFGGQGEDIDLFVINVFNPGELV